MSLRPVSIVVAALAITVASLAPTFAEEGGEDAGPNLHHPVFSPDGRQVVFMSDRSGGDWELFIATTDGQNVRRLTDHTGYDGYAIWSPDGTKLLFDRGEDKIGKKKQPFVYDLKRAEARILRTYETWVTGNEWVDEARLIGFREGSGPDAQRDLVWIDARTGELTSLTDTPTIREGDAHLSHDRKTLYFVETEGGHSSLASLDLETESRRTLLKGQGRLYGIAVSPDGKRIAYNDVPEGEENAEIYLYEIASGRTERLTRNDAWDHMPVWTPDGSRLMFTSYRSGREEPYLMDPASGETYRLSFD